MTENMEDCYFPFITHSLFPLTTPTNMDCKSKSESFLDITLNKEKEDHESDEINMEDSKQL